MNWPLLHCIAGGFPPELATAQMEGLYLSKANLSKAALPALANMTNLREAMLDGNRFTGTLPASLPGTVQKLSLAGNQLQGSLPAGVSCQQPATGRIQC